MTVTSTPEVVKVGNLKVKKKLLNMYPKLAGFLQEQKTAAALVWCMQHSKDINFLTEFDKKEIANFPLWPPYDENHQQQQLELSTSKEEPI